jgi:preprotein translocase subunit SecG
VIYLLETIHILVCIFLILVVLLQQGKGADLSVFGGGTTQTAFGARGATTLLHKLTVASFVIFVLTTISIAILQNRFGGSSVMRGVASRPASTAPARKPAAAPVAPAPAAPPAPAVPAPAPGAPGHTPR